MEEQEHKGRDGGGLQIYNASNDATAVVVGCDAPAVIVTVMLLCYNVYFPHGPHMTY